MLLLKNDRKTRLLCSSIVCS